MSEKTNGVLDAAALAAAKQPRIVAQIVISLDERGGVSANHPPDMMMTLAMMEMAKLAMIEQRAVHRAQTGIALAGQMPAMQAVK